MARLTVVPLCAVGCGEGQTLRPWTPSSWTRPCWTLRFRSTPTASCSPWGSRSPSKVREDTCDTHTRTRDTRGKPHLSFLIAIDAADSCLPLSSFRESPSRLCFCNMTRVRLSSRAAFLSLLSVLEALCLNVLSNAVSQPGSLGAPHPHHQKKKVGGGASLDWVVAPWAVSLFENVPIIYVFIEKMLGFFFYFAGRIMQFNKFNNLFTRHDGNLARVFFIFAE